jgi:carboxypeptidase C (cathepsin A)
MYKFFALFMILTAFLFADEQPDKSPDKSLPEFKAEFPKEVVSETKHSVTIDGKPIAYRAIAANIVLKQENGKPRANIFYIAYLKEGTTDYSKRPLTFSFNGGPGSSSVWLHLGLLGPRRVQMTDEGQAMAPPYKLVDNENSMLDQTDLVFIDPVTTGFSRAVPGEDPKQFHGYQEDIETVSEFIRIYTTRNERWSSPKFIIGESYGTTRAAGLSGYLEEHDGLYLNGIILVSSILNFETADFNPGNDLPYLLYLPTYTATAWYHKKLPADLQSDLRKALDQSEAFVYGEYADALMKGDRITAEEKRSAVEKLARFTGLSTQFVDESNIRIPIFRFVKELLRTERQTVGRLDSRFEGRDADAAGESFEYDPSYAAIQGPFTASLNQYLRVELKYESDLPYEILTGRVQPWSFKNYENQYLNVADTLRGAINRNPHLKIFVANGFYDLATPFFATRYTFDHLGLEPDLRGNISMGFYEAGHMMYIHKPSLIQLKKDLTHFLQDAK